MALTSPRLEIVEQPKSVSPEGVVDIFLLPVLAKFNRLQGGMQGLLGACKGC